MSTPQKHDPSPSEIAAECLLIQQDWSPRERMSRMRVDLRPTYRRCDGEQETMTGAAYDDHHRES